jgi:hypothetical protein
MPGSPRPDAVTETGGYIWRREMPAILRLKGIRDVSEYSLVAYRGGLTLYHEIEAIERVAPRSQDATHRFCASS